MKDIMRVNLEKKGQVGPLVPDKDKKYSVENNLRVYLSRHFVTESVLVFKKSHVIHRVI